VLDRPLDGHALPEAGDIGDGEGGVDVEFPLHLELFGRHVALLSARPAAHGSSGRT
jgi:hypothetical protein